MKYRFFIKKHYIDIKNPRKYLLILDTRRITNFIEKNYHQDEQR